MRGSGPTHPKLRIGDLLAFLVFLVILVAYMSYDRNQDFQRYIPPAPEDTAAYVPRTTIPIHNYGYGFKNGKPKYQDPNIDADPTDLQAEEEGLYEDSSEDFNPRKK